MRIPKDAKVQRELRYGHMVKCGFAKWITRKVENWDGEMKDDSYWEYDNDGYDDHLRTLDLSQREIDHLTKEYDREIDLGPLEAAEKQLGRTIWLGQDSTP